MPVTDSLRWLAQRQDFTGVFARTKIRLEQVADVLVGDMPQEIAVEWWRTAGETLDELAEKLADVYGADVSGGQMRQLADRLRAVAAVIDEADLG